MTRLDATVEYSVPVTRRRSTRRERSESQVSLSLSESRVKVSARELPGGLVPPGPETQRLRLRVQCYGDRGY